MKLGDVDSFATLGRTPLHRIPATVKLWSFGFVLVAVLVTTNALIALSLVVALIAAVVALRLPTRTLLGFAAYAGFFGALFALATATDVWSLVLIASKAMAAALGALALTFTTPYPALFAPIQRVLPVVIGDGLLMTYRSFFLLLDRMDHTLTSARLRAGRPKSLAVGGRLVAQALGGTVLYSIDLSQRTYDVMRLRGYAGRLVVSPERGGRTGHNAVLLCAAGALLSIAIAWRVWWPLLNPYAWVPLVLGLTALVAASAVRIALRKEGS